jgi:hypothetical protein
MQKTLAIELGVGSTYLSTLEKGRKSHPQNNFFFQKDSKSSGFFRKRNGRIKTLGIATETLGPLASHASLLQLEMAVNFTECLVLLHLKQIRAIQAILDITEQQPKRLSCRKNLMIERKLRIP